MISPMNETTKDRIFPDTVTGISVLPIVVACIRHHHRASKKLVTPGFTGCSRS